MENLVVEVAENVFNDFPMFPYRRRTLPEKIIRLRKVSQECHVRRMKFALRKKQMQALQGTSDISLSFCSCSTSSVNRTNSSPSASINYRNVGNDIDGDKNEDSSSKVSNFPARIQRSNDRKKDCYSRFTNVNRCKKTDNFSAENNSVKSDTALDLCCRKKSMIHPNCKINKRFNIAANNDKPDKTPGVQDGRKINDKNEVKNDKKQASSDAFLKGNASSKGSWRPFDNIVDSIHLNRLKMKKDKDYEDSLNRSLENFHLTDAKNAEIETKGSNTSKIPILQSRLPSAKKNKPKQSLQMISIRKSNMINTENIQHSPKVSNENGSLENSQAKTPKVTTKSTPESSLNETILRDFECNPEEKSCHVSEFNYKSEELTSNTLHSVSRWLQESVAKAEKCNEKSNVSQAKSLVVDLNSPMENFSLKTPTTPKPNVFKTASSLTYSVKDSCSGSEESLDYFYETETGDEVIKNVLNRSDEDQNAWEEDSDDVSVELPADIEDKIISTPENYAKDKYSDYPKTPYDLRYPRYYSRECNDKLRNVEENSTQSKTQKKKIRRKSRNNLTPKMKRGKKTKSNLSCKIQASKSKQA